MIIILKPNFEVLIFNDRGKPAKSFKNFSLEISSYSVYARVHTQNVLSTAMCTVIYMSMCANYTSTHKQLATTFPTVIDVLHRHAHK